MYNAGGTDLTLLSKGISTVSLTTNTLSAGSSATGSASVSGDQLNLTLGIPTGATGAAGTDGADGEVSAGFAIAMSIAL